MKSALAQPTGAGQLREDAIRLRCLDRFVIGQITYMPHEHRDPECLSGLDDVFT
jgi:hypothetical protein